MSCLKTQFLYIFGALFVLAVPFTSLAATTYTRIPAGNVISDSFTINFSVDDINEICPAFFGNNFDGYSFSLLRSSDTSIYTSGLESPLFTALNSSYAFSSVDTRDIVYVSLNCRFDGNTIYAVGVLEGNGSTIFTINPAIIQPPVVSGNIFGAGGLIGTSTNLLAAVTTGVVDTGVNIWPLFLFVGVALAFVIAIKVQNFIMAAGAKERSEIKEDKPTKKRYARFGEYKAFKRGKKNNPGLWVD